MIHLREISLVGERKNNDVYPLNIPVVKGLDKLSFTSPVTVFVGDNGSGKSTLLEAIARAAELPAVGSEEVNRDATLKMLQPLVDSIKLVWTKRTRRGFFLRTEDFFGFVKRVHELRFDMLEELERVERDYRSRSEYAKNLAKMPAQSSVKALEHRYGADLDAQSHGESFLALFQSRCVPGGLYLLDEPEAALSPISQLGLIAMIKDMVAKEAQFILATHSPILMAVPDALLHNFDQAPPCGTTYDELEHVQLYRSFLSDPEAYLHRL